MPMSLTGEKSTEARTLDENSLGHKQERTNISTYTVIWLNWYSFFDTTITYRICCKVQYVGCVTAFKVCFFSVRRISLKHDVTHTIASFGLVYSVHKSISLVGESSIFLSTVDFADHIIMLERARRRVCRVYLGLSPRRRWRYKTDGVERYVIVSDRLQLL